MTRFFLSEATNIPMKITDLPKGQVGYFNLPAQKTNNFNSISTDDMDLQSVNNEQIYCIFAVVVTFQKSPRMMTRHYKLHIVKHTKKLSMYDNSHMQKIQFKLKLLTCVSFQIH
jgi:hypothetical protein